MHHRSLVVSAVAILALSTSPRPLPAEFRFTVTADGQGNTDGFGQVLGAINDLVGGPGAFHITAGDLIFYIGNISNSRQVVDEHFGEDFLWYVAPGNHDVADMVWLRSEYHDGNGKRAPLKDFTKGNGPEGTKETTYSWDYENAHFVVLNEFWDGTSDIGADGNIVPELYDWLAADLAANQQPVTFVIGHEPAFPYVRHVGDSLDAYPENRDAFWQLLEDHDVTAYICGHTHYYSTHRGNKDGVGDVWQINPAAAGFGRASGPDMFLDVLVGDTSVVFSAYENADGWHVVDTVVIPEPSGILMLAIALATIGCVAGTRPRKDR